MSLNEQQQKDIKALETHLEIIQKFVDENIVQKNKAMPSAQIYSGLSSSLPNIDESLFKRSFSLNVKEGNIKGIVGAKRAGFKPINEKENEVEDDVNDTLPAPPPITTDDEHKTCIAITKSLRLYGVDKRNWALQKVQDTAGGRVWLSQNYWPTLDCALKGVARFLLNKEIKGSKLNTNDIKDVVKCIHEAENRIHERLSSLVNENKHEDLPSSEEINPAQQLYEDGGNDGIEDVA